MSTLNARGHLSTETIDLLLMGSLSAGDGQAAHAHLGTCPACKQRFSELTEDRARFEQFVFPRTLEKIEARLAPPTFAEQLRKARRWLVPAASAVVAASIAIVVVATQPKNIAGEVSYIGEKGAAALDVVASRPALGQFTVKPGAVLHPKDRIRFVVSPAGAKFVLIASRDGKGTFTVYHPFGGASSAPITPGAREVPGSVELDEVEGPERLVAVYSETPVSALDVKAALEANPDAPKIAGAKVVTWEFVKAAAARTDPNEPSMKGSQAPAPEKKRP